VIINRGNIQSVLARLGITAITPDATATASSTVARDGNANIVADIFIPGAASTPTAGGSTALTVDSKSIQVFTGSSAQTCVLPTTTVPVGMPFTIVNQSSQFVTVNSSGANLVTYVAPGSCAMVVANTATPTTAAHWTIAVYPGTVNNALGAVVVRDVVGMVAFTNAAPSQTTTATSGGTLTLGYGSNTNRTHIFTGSSNHTLALPSTGIPVGMEFVIVNLSTGSITVNASGGALVTTVAAGKSARVMSTTTPPTTAAHWAVLSVSP
jgi:hypothetical protein